MDAPDLDQRMLRKAEAVIQWRTTRLILVIERCTNDHNYSAILRTAEALGIQLIYMIDPPEIEEDMHQAKTQKQQSLIEKATPEELEQRRQHHFFARNAQEWLTIRDFETTEDCVSTLKSEGYDLWVTDLSQHAECLTMTTPKVPDKVALVMGTEAVGCSQYMLDIADKRVYLPLRGFADSLNLSVATALVIHHLFVMDPTLIGGITEEEKHDLRTDWYAKLCQQRLLTNSQKKSRQKLLLNIQKCQSITERMEKPENAGKAIQPQEQKKLDELPKYEAKLAELNALVDPIKVQAAVQEWVENPPQPLTDVRRADLHRICYVGKNTRTKHQDHWKDMVATSDQKSMQGTTSAAFREKVNAES
jgi:tRNA(Leu) C34 or U34 (ribose-2'-O)-methylase TrmL